MLLRDEQTLTEAGVRADCMVEMRPAGGLRGGGGAEDTQLLKAAEKGDEAEVRRLLGKGANLEAKDGVRARLDRLTAPEPPLQSPKSPVVISHDLPAYLVTIWPHLRSSSPDRIAGLFLASTLSVLCDALVSPLCLSLSLTTLRSIMRAKRATSPW